MTQIEKPRNNNSYLIKLNQNLTHYIFSYLPAHEQIKIIYLNKRFRALDKFSIGFLKVYKKLHKLSAGQNERYINLINLCSLKLPLFTLLKYLFRNIVDETDIENVC